MKTARSHGLERDAKQWESMDPLISQAEARGRFNYDAETGVFTDKATGKPAGKVDAHGYLCARIGGRTVPLHRLAFLWMLGHWPRALVDHVNGKVDDNRWGNLRLATPTQNAQNRRAVKSSNPAKEWHKGVKVGKDGRYRVTITVDGVMHNVPGSFDSASQAEKVYRETCHRMFGQFERTVGAATVNAPSRDDPHAKAAQLDVLMRRREVVLQQLTDIDRAINALCADAKGKTPQLVSPKEFSALRFKEKKEKREAMMKQRAMAFAQLNKLHPLQQ